MSTFGYGYVHCTLSKEKDVYTLAYGGGYFSDKWRNFQFTNIKEVEQRFDFDADLRYAVVGTLTKEDYYKQFITKFLDFLTIKMKEISDGDKK